MAFQLPDLPYEFNALEPHIDEQTMRIHHGKHHAAYVNNVNKALEGHSDLQAKSINELMAQVASLPDSIRTAVNNNGGGHLNHSIFWQNMSPAGGGDPTGSLGKAIDSAFGSFNALKEKFSNAAITRFGSGWAWLCLDRAGSLVVQSFPNQDSPISAGLQPILGLDVWEHAYYLKYQNRRPDYVGAWWNVVNWKDANERFEKAKG
jgi:Fe-Mn family superoxide dismutase